MTHPFTKFTWRAALLCALTLSGVSGLVQADNEQDRARQAVQAGEVLPLATVIERVQQEVPGQILDVELERETDQDLVTWVYKIKLLRTDGALVKLKVDASSGVLISRKSKDPHGSHHGSLPK